MYIDFLTYHEANVRSSKLLSKERGTLTESKLSHLFSLIQQGKLTRLEAENQAEAYSIVVFLEGSNSHVGILDEEEETRYVYDNLQEEEGDVGIGGYDFPKWSVCGNPAILIDILKEFFATGEMLSAVSWREAW